MLKKLLVKLFDKLEREREIMIKKQKMGMPFILWKEYWKKDLENQLILVQGQ